MSGRERRSDSGVEYVKSGKWRCRTSREKGSTKTVTVYFETKAQALVAKFVGDLARAHGEDVEAAMRACSGADNSRGPATRTVTPAPSKKTPDVASERTFAELGSWFFAERQKIVEISDPSRRRSLSRGINSLRYTTQERDCDIYRLHLLPRLGELRISEIDAAVVGAMVVDLASAGFSTNYQSSILMRLRMIIGYARRSELPDDFPWRMAVAIPSHRPLRPKREPERWGGEIGSAEPVLPLVEMMRLAAITRSTYRVANYLCALAGLRPGEAFGLKLKDLSWRDGYLWLHIKRQLIESNVEVEWAKTDSSYRRIPVPAILSDYLVDYVRKYHAGDLYALDSDLGERRLVVNPAGRDNDGGFLPGLRSNWAGSFSKDRDLVGLGHADLGYELKPHHQRKSHSTYLLHAAEIIASIDEELYADEPEDPAELIAFLRARLDTASRSTINYSPINISAYLGHQYDGKDDPLAASTTTLTHYNLSVNKGRTYIAIADAMERIARYELGVLYDEPDVEDLLPVYFPGDAEYMTAKEAAKEIGISSGNVTVAVSQGRLSGHLGWLADGGWRKFVGVGKPDPSTPQMFVTRASVKEMVRLRGMPSLKEAGWRLSMSSEAVAANFVRTGLLPAEETASTLRVSPDHLDRLVSRIHDGVVDCVPPKGWIDVEHLRGIFNQRHGSIFVQGRATERWMEAWLRQLVVEGRLQRNSEGKVARVRRGE